MIKISERLKVWPFGNENILLFSIQNKAEPHEVGMMSEKKISTKNTLPSPSLKLLLICSIMTMTYFTNNSSIKVIKISFKFKLLCCYFSVASHVHFFVTPANCSMLGFMLHYLLEFAQIYLKFN